MNALLENGLLIMSKRTTPESEMPAPENGRPLGGQLDGLDALFDFKPAFDKAVSQVTAPGPNTRRALHELVCVTATRLHIERVVLVPLIAAHHPNASEYQKNVKTDHRRIEMLLALIDRRAPSDPDLASMFDELQDVVMSNIERQRSASAVVRAALTNELTIRLRGDLMAAVDTAMTRPHPHLPHQGPFGKLTTALIPRIDRLRNHVPVR
jgi:hypothetical protein